VFAYLALHYVCRIQQDHVVVQIQTAQSVHQHYPRCVGKHLRHAHQRFHLCVAAQPPASAGIMHGHGLAFEAA
jgi:hypothetical protein